MVDSLSDSEVAEGATELLRRIHKNVLLPSPRYFPILVVGKYLNIDIHSRVTRNPWTSDPFTMGAYSYPTTGAKEGDQVVLHCCHKKLLNLNNV